MMRIAAAGLLAAVLGAAGAARAAEGEGATRPALDGTLSLRGDLWSGSRDLDDAGPVAQASAWGRAKVDLGDAGTLVGDGWLAARGGADRPAPHGRVRELYWRGTFGPLDLRIGRQIIAWGRADGLNPTDNLTPRDFTLLVPEDGEQRRGNDALQASVETGAGVLSAVWLPRGGSHRVPLPRTPQVMYDEADPPRRDGWALKWDLAGDGIDGSLSYFDGTDPLPDLALAGAGPDGVQVAVRNHRLRAFGGDLSWVQGRMVWRAEAAWMRSGSAGAADFVRKRDRLWLVGGGEWTFDGGTTLGLQALVQHVPGFVDPDTLATPVEREIAGRQAALANQTAANQLGASWRLAHRFRNDTASAELSGVWTGAPDSSLWRTRFTVALSDAWQLQAGTDATFGPAKSLWGQFRANRLAFVQLRRGL